MSKRVYDPIDKCLYEEVKPPAKDEYSYKAKKLDPDLKYGGPEKRRHSFREIMKKYRNNKDVAKGQK